MKDKMRRITIYQNGKIIFTIKCMDSECAFTFYQNGISSCTIIKDDKEMGFVGHFVVKAEDI